LGLQGRGRARYRVRHVVAGVRCGRCRGGPWGCLSGRATGWREGHGNGRMSGIRVRCEL
jgi:hypothetical protein